MATITTAFTRRLTRPAANADHRTRAGQRTVGIWLGVVGLLLATVALIANLSVADTVDSPAGVATLAWSFGVTTTAFAVLKSGIAIVLIGILARLAMRVHGVRTALPRLRAAHHEDITVEHGQVRTAFGRATVTAGEPKALLIHRMAQALWAPMLAMGAMAVVAGLVVSFIWSAAAADGSPATVPAAWTQGLQFLGEGMLLSGISFLLGSILAGLRAGGGEVQSSLGLPVTTLRMPTSAALFVLLMMSGMMVSIAQFVVYLWVATQSDVVTVAAHFAWLGPFRELGLGLLLSGIVLALATIARVLGFQFWRIRQIIQTGV